MAPISLHQFLYYGYLLNGTNFFYYGYLLNGTNFFKFEDKYNWDIGKGVTIGKIPISDVSMGAFHLQGLAREFIMRGSYPFTLSWSKGDSEIEVEDGWDTYGGR